MAWLQLDSTCVLETRKQIIYVPRIKKVVLQSPAVAENKEKKRCCNSPWILSSGWVHILGDLESTTSQLALRRGASRTESSSAQKFSSACVPYSQPFHDFATPPLTLPPSTAAWLHPVRSLWVRKSSIHKKKQSSILVTKLSS